MCLTLLKMKFLPTEILIYFITVFLLASVEIPCLSAEAGFEGFRRIIRNAAMDNSGRLSSSLTTQKTEILCTQSLYNKVTNPHLTTEVAAKTNTAYSNNLITSAAAWTVCSSTMASVTLETKSQTRALWMMFND